MWDGKAVELKAVCLVGMSHKINKIWNHLGKLAYDDGADFFVLLGDDVKIETPDWPARMLSHFDENPVGCVAFNDLESGKSEDDLRRFPDGFPTFSIIPRSHIDIIGRILPLEFEYASQDGDPWIFSIYQHVNRSATRKDCVLRNSRVGSLYHVVHVGGTWNDTMQWGRGLVSEYLKGK